MTIGTGFLMVGRDLDMGSSFRMGPGYFPTVLSVLMIALGLAITVLALRCPAGEGGSTPLPWRGLLLIIGGAVFFGFAVRGLGLAPVVLGVVLASAWASRYAALRSSLSLSAGLAVFCTFLFIQLLGLPLPLTGPWLSLEQGSPLASADRPGRSAIRCPVGDIPHGTSRRSRARLRHRAQPLQPALLLRWRSLWERRSACCRAWGRSPPSPCCCRSPSACRRFHP